MNFFKKLYEPVKPYVDKVMRDNIGVLAAILAWNTLTSLVPIVIGLVAISGLVMQGRANQDNVVAHLSHALQGALSTTDLHEMVTTASSHAGLFGIIAIAGVLWGGSNIGGALSTVFQAVFEVGGRNFIKEKLIDIGMIFVLAILMIIIIAGTTFSTVITGLFKNFPLSSVSSFAIGIAVSLIAGFLLFFAIFAVFPNTEVKMKVGHVWAGAFVSAVLFEALSLIWPLYAHFAHFSRYGTVLVPILVLTAWIYFFSVITIIGAEVVAILTLKEANRLDISIGPEPQNYIPQHRVLREV